MIQRGKP
ncbi:hypothetical protein YPPY64_2085, partial [Yersinia pestis PY-64]